MVSLTLLRVDWQLVGEKQGMCLVPLQVRLRLFMEWWMQGKSQYAKCLACLCLHIYCLLIIRANLQAA
jgi:hypothetical protein